MLYLPSIANDLRMYQKLDTYITLFRVGCPVFKSIVIEKDDQLTLENINLIRNYLGSDYCTLRYQYIRPNFKPVRGGNKILITSDHLTRMIVPDTLLWLLEPIDRLENNYGINLFFNQRTSTLYFECVGRGFDVSDLNRGNITPHQIILYSLPIEYGWNNEWWKYAKFFITSKVQYDTSKKVRIEKLQSLGLTADYSIFDENYKPLTSSILERLMYFSEQIFSAVCHEEEFVVSCSIDKNSNPVFWDIQTPTGKINIIGADQKWQV